MENYKEEKNKLKSDLEALNIQLIDLLYKGAELYGRISDIANNELMTLEEVNDFISSVLFTDAYLKLDNLMDVFEYLADPLNNENVMEVASNMLSKYLTSEQNVLH